MMRALRGTILLFLIGSVMGCGYTLVGRGSVLPEHIRSIQVPTFVNRTTRVELEQRLTQAVADELVSRGNLRLVSSEPQADAVLRGAIDGFGITPVAFNEQGRATRYQISVSASIELIDRRNEDAVLWKNEHYRYTENYAVEAGSLDAFDQETRAIREIAVRFAESIVTSILEGF
jgi:outer membrane lipopolysaccharide assembly protein LptE/RlpB